MGWLIVFQTDAHNARLLSYILVHSEICIHIIYTSAHTHWYAKTHRQRSVVYSSEQKADKHKRCSDE